MAWLITKSAGGGKWAAMTEDRAADLYWAAKSGDRPSIAKWNQFSAEMPHIARLGVTWHEMRSAGVAKHAGAHCLSCGKSLKPRKPRCGGCGRRNPVFVAKKVPPVKRGKIPKMTAKSAKAARPTERERWQAIAGADSRGEALNRMWREALASPVPEVRLAAERFLSRREVPPA